MILAFFVTNHRKKALFCVVFRLINHQPMNKKLIILLVGSMVCLLGWSIFQSRWNTYHPDLGFSPEKKLDKKEEEVSGAGKSLDAWSMARSYPTEKINGKKFTEGHQVRQRLLSD